MTKRPTIPTPSTLLVRLVTISLATLVLLMLLNAQANPPAATASVTAATRPTSALRLTGGENLLFSDAARRGGVASQVLAFINKNVKNARTCESSLRS